MASRSTFEPARSTTTAGAFQRTANGRSAPQSPPKKLTLSHTTSPTVSSPKRAVPVERSRKPEPASYTPLPPLMFQTRAPLDRKDVVDIEFEQLLDSMNLPQLVRSRMATTAFSVKESMLRSAATATTAPIFTTLPPSPVKRSSARLGSDAAGRERPGDGRQTHSMLGSGSATFTMFKKDPATERKSRSGHQNLTISIPHSQSSVSIVSLASKDHDLPPLPLSATMRYEDQPISPASRTPTVPSVTPRTSPRKPLHVRNGSSSIAANPIAFFKSLSRSTAPPLVAPGSPTKSSMTEASSLAASLRATPYERLEPTQLSDVWRRLRSERLEWVEEFLRCEGLVGLLDKLGEVLALEFRSEQRDDQMLHSILRCLIAVTETTCGQIALAQFSTTPYVQLAALLFSEKRPGNLSTRQLVVKILTDVLIVLPLGLEEFSAGRGRLSKSDWEAGINLWPRGIEGRTTGDRGRRIAAQGFLLELLKAPPNPKDELALEFMMDARKPRVFKQWIMELSGIKRDYFWMLCHMTNTYDSLDELDTVAIEAPQVPCGMTDGVENEAILYVTSCFKLVNSIAGNCATEELAFAFHLALFQSGFGEILLDFRTVSKVYYKVFHLELARYISLARAARFNLQAQILQHLDPRILSAAEREIVDIARARDREELERKRQMEREATRGKGGIKLLEVNF